MVSLPQAERVPYHKRNDAFSPPAGSGSGEQVGASMRGNRRWFRTRVAHAHRPGPLWKTGPEA